MIPTIQVTFPGGKRVDASVGAFTVRTDQPKEGGGEGSAPGPYDVFLASIAACAGIYVLGFCQARGLSTEGLSLAQSHEVDPETGLVKAVKLAITLPPGFPERLRPAVLKAAAGCKVKKTLAAVPSFEIVAVEPVVAVEPTAVAPA